MNRLTPCMLILAAALVLAPRNAHAQMPVANSGNLVTPVTDAGASSPTVAGLRGWTGDLRLLRAWFSAAITPVGYRAPRAAVRPQRTPLTRSRF